MQLATSAKEGAPRVFAVRRKYFRIPTHVSPAKPGWSPNSLLPLHKTTAIRVWTVSYYTKEGARQRESRVPVAWDLLSLPVKENVATPPQFPSIRSILLSFSRHFSCLELRLFIQSRLRICRSGSSPPVVPLLPCLLAYIVRHPSPAPTAAYRLHRPHSLAAFASRPSNAEPDRAILGRGGKQNRENKARIVDEKSTRNKRKKKEPVPKRIAPHPKYFFLALFRPWPAILFVDAGPPSRFLSIYGHSHAPANSCARR